MVLLIAWVGICLSLGKSYNGSILNIGKILSLKKNYTHQITANLLHSTLQGKLSLQLFFKMNGCNNSFTR